MAQQIFFTLDKVLQLLQVKDPSVDRDTQADVDNSVLFPITVEATFADTKTDAQQYTYVIDNTDDSARSSSIASTVIEVRKKVGTPDNWEETDDDPLMVEMPLLHSHADNKTDSQGYAFRLDNGNTADSFPLTPDAYQRLKDAGNNFFQVVRYTADNTPECETWIDVVLRNVLAVTDPKTDAQDKLFRVQQASAGIPIDDPDDPYQPTMAVVDVTLDWADAVKSDTINPPYRSSIFEYPVNFNFAGACEFEKPGHPVGDPKIAPSVHSATTAQDSTKVPDATKFLFSGFFNFPHGQDTPDSDGGWPLIEFGGNDATNTPYPGDPSNSIIQIARGLDSHFNDVYQVRAGFVGGTKAVDWDLGNTFWGFPASFVDLTGNLPYGPGAGGPQEGTIQRGFGGNVSIGNNEKFQAFLENWHHLAVKWDLDGATGWNDYPIAIRFFWVLEVDGGYDLTSTPTGINGWNAPIRNAMIAFNLSMADLDPFNTLFSPIVDIRLNTLFPNQPGRFTTTLLPDANTMPRQRLYVLHQGNEGISGYVDPTTGYIGSGVTSWPFAEVDSIQDPSIKRYIPFQMILDRTTKMDSNDSGFDDRALISFILSDTSIFSADSKTGVVVKDRQIGIPRKSFEKSSTEGSFTIRKDVDTRLGIYQTWFNPSSVPDLYTSPVKDRFTSTFVAADQKTYFRPASLATGDVVDPNNPPLSHAAALYGKPDIFMKGARGTQAIGKPADVMASGFPKNQGSAGDFIKTDATINYSPSPNKIPLP